MNNQNFIPTLVNTGDTLWMYDDRNREGFKLFPVYVTRIRTDTDLSTDYINANNYTRFQIFAYEEGTEHYSCHEIKPSDFGKTVFFSKEDFENKKKYNFDISIHTTIDSNEMLSILSDADSCFTKACRDARINGCDQPNRDQFIAEYILSHTYCISKNN